jgi:hypothetical protein
MMGLGLVSGASTGDFLGDFGFGGGFGFGFPFDSPWIIPIPSLVGVTSLLGDVAELDSLFSELVSLRGDIGGVTLLHEGDVTPIRGENLVFDVILNISEGEIIGRVVGITTSVFFIETATLVACSSGMDLIDSS